MIALIPARGGSKRIPRKNIKPLGGYPLIAWTIAAAKASGLFSDLIVSTDDAEIRSVAYEFGAHGMYRGTDGSDDEPDIAWVRDYFGRAMADKPDSFAILRPTSPFRTVDMLQRAYKQFKGSEVHSIRAVEPVKQHPGKMWQCIGAGYPMVPIIDSKWPAPTKDGLGVRASREDAPWHSLPTQSLPAVYVQNASLEMAWTYVVQSFGTISGTKVAPFFTHGYEGFDINTPDDWREAERLIAEGLVELPRSYVAGVSSAPAQV